MEFQETINQIHAIMSEHLWFDMELGDMDGRNLSIIGSIDLSYCYTLDIIFEDFIFICISSSWHTDPTKPVIEVVGGDEFGDVNSIYPIEQGYTLFKIIAEHVQKPFYIAAKGLRFKNERVLYYKKDNLEDNERIADWVK